MSNKSEAEKGPESPKWLKKKKLIHINYEFKFQFIQTQKEFDEEIFQ